MSTAATAKSRLATFLHARGVPEDLVTYECNQGGAAHLPSFEATATVLGRTASGTAHRKKAAEGQAAEALLLVLQTAAAAGELPAMRAVMPHGLNSRQNNRGLAREWQQVRRHSTCSG